MEHTEGTVKIARDPICGMAVDPAKAAATIEFNGQLYYFCSKSCAAKFQQNPNKFVAAAANATSAQHQSLAQIATPVHSDSARGAGHAENKTADAMHSCCSHATSSNPQSPSTAAVAETKSSHAT